MRQILSISVLISFISSFALSVDAQVNSPITKKAVEQVNWKQVQTNSDAQLRGLSVVSPKIAWASGVKGTVLKTIDGEHWLNVAITEANHLDFRDIHAFSATTAIAMSAGPGNASTIHKTTDGGTTWKLVLVNPDANGFWDAMDFWDDKNGVIFGDPVNGQFQILLTQDGGNTWQAAANKDHQLTALSKEGAFAASGTCVTVNRALDGTQDIWFVTGGAEVSRVFHSSDRGVTWSNSIAPIPAAAAPKGLFSVAFLDNQRGFVVGGDYSQASLNTNNGAMTQDGGLTWKAAPVMPQGFLSVVMTLPRHNNVLIAGGLTGIGVSKDAGLTWRAIGTTPINAIAFADERHGWAVGPKGLIIQYVGRSVLLED
jgi:photosystem II stability/assembly factor-like uncharacterized protein